MAELQPRPPSQKPWAWRRGMPGRNYGLSGLGRRLQGLQLALCDCGRSSLDDQERVTPGNPICCMAIRLAAAQIESNQRPAGGHARNTAAVTQYRNSKPCGLQILGCGKAAQQVVLRCALAAAVLLNEGVGPCRSQRTCPGQAFLCAGTSKCVQAPAHTGASTMPCNARMHGGTPACYAPRRRDQAGQYMS